MIQKKQKIRVRFTGSYEVDAYTHNEAQSEFERKKQITILVEDLNTKHWFEVMMINITGNLGLMVGSFLFMLYMLMFVNILQLIKDMPDDLSIIALIGLSVLFLVSFRLPLRMSREIFNATRFDDGKD